MTFYISVPCPFCGGEARNWGHLPACRLAYFVRREQWKSLRASDISAPDG